MFSLLQRIENYFVLKIQSSGDGFMSDESGKINLGDYSDYVRIVFNSRIDKWELNMLEDGKHVLRKHFFDKREAEMQALHYLGQIGVLNSGNLSKEKEKRTISRHSGIYYSDAKNMWGVKVKGYRGSRLLGYYRSEEEAIQAKEDYLAEKSAKQKAMRNERNIKTEALISFSERAGLWVVRVPRRRGGYKLLDYYDSEEEAVEAKDAYFRELESDGSES